jgi:hypothetical protein
VEWFVSVRPRKLPIFGTTVQKQVKVAKKLGKSEFMASTAQLGVSERDLKLCLMKSVVKLPCL